MLTDRLMLSTPSLYFDLFVQASNQGDLLENVTLSIPIFHCYGHKAFCQAQLVTTVKLSQHSSRHSSRHSSQHSSHIRKQIKSADKDHMLRAYYLPSFKSFNS